MKQTLILSTLSIFVLFSCQNETNSDTQLNQNTVNDTTIIIEESSIVEEEDTATLILANDSIIDNNNTNLIVETFAPNTSDEEIFSLPVVINPDTKVSEPEEIVIIKPNHTSWDNLLKANVTSNGSVNYANMKNSLTAINSYVTQLENLTDQSSWSRNEKLAYWINLYNAATVRLIVQNYPVKSITDINGGKPWDLKVVKIGSKNYTLNQIENDIIRPKFNEPRIHFAVNCAAKSCPKLMNSAFMPNQLNSQLTKQAKSFINSGKNNITVNKISISKIFEWYADDFGSSVIDYLNKYSDVKIETETPIEYMEYNWDLNK